HPHPRARHGRRNSNSIEANRERTRDMAASNVVQSTWIKKGVSKHPAFTIANCFKTAPRANSIRNRCYRAPSRDGSRDYLPLARKRQGVDIFLPPAPKRFTSFDE